MRLEVILLLKRIEYLIVRSIDWCNASISALDLDFSFPANIQVVS